MPSPLYNAIKGTTAGTPGTGAFTPNAATTGFRAWSNVPTGWIGLVRYDDGANWELCYSYWNGTTLSRGTNQLSFDNPGGVPGSSLLSLTSAATAHLIADASDIMPHPGTTPWRGWFANLAGTTPIGPMGQTPTATGTGAASAIAATNYLTEQPRNKSTSATTANAQAGWSNTTASIVTPSSTAGRSGAEFVSRFGASQLPTGPRMFLGFTSVNYVGSTAEPSVVVANCFGFAKDSTDTNFQLYSNNGSVAGTKVDTGIPPVANGWYEFAAWYEPGLFDVRGMLIRLDTGAIFLGATGAHIPTSGNTMIPNALMGLNGTNTGTAVIPEIGQFVWRQGQ